MKYDPKTVVLEHDGGYVKLYSFKLQKVIYTKDPQKAKVFTSIKSQEFIRAYANKGGSFTTGLLIIHVIKPGTQFNPVKEKENENP